MSLFSKEYQQSKRINTLPFRSFYVPFSKGDEVKYKCDIIDKYSSSKLIPLNGIWKIKEHQCIEDITDIDELINDDIKVPGCVQLFGYDYIQYVNVRYPFKYDPPHIQKENPTYHYRKIVNINKEDNTRYHLVFEGVDSAFYLFVNSKKVGYSLITHSLSEFDITDYLFDGDNTIDVIVLKWNRDSYLEDQDKFRFTGIIKDVYILKRNNNYIKDFKVTTGIIDKEGYINITNLSDDYFFVSLLDESDIKIEAKETKKFKINNPSLWSDKSPYLYEIKLYNENEIIYQKVGIRSVEIKDGVFLINGIHQKLKGVNRHETNPYTGSYVTVEDTYKDLKLIKSCYVNAIRTSHYPNIPEFYEMCNALGLYVMDEADLETHGVTTSQGGYDLKLWKEFTENGLYDYSVTQREMSLYERDKNYSCVIIFSLGNESSFGPMFYEGIKYIKSHDDRPIHYEGIFNIKEFDEELYYTKDIDIISRMYPPYEWMKEDYLKDKRETRPLVLCEYSHAMGNSNGDIKDYFDIINSSNRFMGGFIWEWCDHAIIKDDKLLYGGEFNEPIHDGNFCVDGLVTPFREIKTNTLEMIEIYKGENKKEKLKARLMPLKNYGNKDKINDIYKIDNQDGEIKEIIINNKNILLSPLNVNFLRAKIDNENFKIDDINLIKNSERKIINYKRKDNVITFEIILINNNVPLINYMIKYTLFNEYIDINLKYKILKEDLYVQKVGLYFKLDKDNDSFIYYGYGPYESYVDKHHYDYLDEFKIDINNIVTNNLKPQDYNERYYCSYLKLKDIDVYALKSFSLNVLPYDYKYIESKNHNYELINQDGTFVSIDIFASGIGSNSCGPELKKEYQVPLKGHNTFRIKFN